MAELFSNYSALEVPLGPWPVTSERFVGDPPTMTGQVMWRSESGRAASGVWTCTPGTIQGEFLIDEVSVIVAGRMTITAEGPDGRGEGGRRDHDAQGTRGRVGDPRAGDEGVERVLAGSAAVLSDRAALLGSFADTLVPRVERDGADAETTAYLRRSASDFVPADVLAAIAPPRYEPVLAELEAAGFVSLDIDARTQLLVELGARGGEARQLLRELKGAVMGLFYALPENPSWPALGFPGPVTAAPSAEEAPKTIRVESLAGPRATLEADVCIVGSGAGGSVIAAELQRPAQRRRARACRLSQRGGLPSARGRRRTGTVPPRGALLLRDGIDGTPRRRDARAAGP